MNIIDTYKEYSKEEIILIKERLLSYKTIITFISNGLKNISELPESNEDIKTNVVYIAPNIKIEKQKFNNQDITFHECLVLYETWLNQVCEAIIKNKQYLKTNDKLYKHMCKVFNECLTVEKHINEFFLNKSN